MNGAVSPEGARMLDPGPTPPVSVEASNYADVPVLRPVAAEQPSHAVTQKIRPVRNGGITHELYLSFTIHGSDPLELTEIGDAISAAVTREAAGRAVVRNKTQITSPVRTAIVGGGP